VIPCEERPERAGPQAAIGRLETETAISGAIVFQSDLDGDNETYLVQGRRIEKLTDNTWHDRYPRWSPDGARIVFCSNLKDKYADKGEWGPLSPRC